jgi:hypothetical protein
MAVNIQIGANADAVKNALKEIEPAIAKAGQAGRQFAEQGPLPNLGDPLAWAHGVGRVFPDPNAATQHIGMVGGYALAGTGWAPGAQQQGSNAQAIAAASAAGAAAGIAAAGGTAGGGGAGGGAAAGGSGGMGAAAGISSMLASMKGGIGFGMALAGVGGLKSERSKRPMTSGHSKRLRRHVTYGLSRDARGNPGSSLSWGLIPRLLRKSRIDTLRSRNS